MSIIIAVLSIFTLDICRARLCGIWEVEMFSNDDTNYNDHCPKGYEKCVDEGELCSTEGTVYYGANYPTNGVFYGKPWTFKKKDGVSGGVYCTTTQFGCDPVGGTDKFCCKKKIEECPALNQDSVNGGRCGTAYGRCNRNLRDGAHYCNENNGWCGTTDAHKNAQSSDIYDFEPTQCLPYLPENCESTRNDFEWDNPNTPFPPSMREVTVDYSNEGYAPQQASNSGVNECSQTTYSIQSTTNWNIKVGVKASVTILGNGVDFSVEASVGGSVSETKTELDSQCVSTSFTSPICPGRTYCTRVMRLSELAAETRGFSVTLVCDGEDFAYHGLMTVSGSFDVDYIDEFKPMDCDYYTTEYNDRTNMLPFCDQCQSSNNCDSCSPDHYLMQNGNNKECVRYIGCTDYCGGSVSCPTEKDCICSNPTTVDSQECQVHLNGTPTLSYTIDDFQCTFDVLSVDHISGDEGKYFNFDMSTVGQILGMTTFERGNYRVFNSRTGKIQEVRMWATDNGGSVGDGHGRIAPISSATVGDWETGDELAFLTPQAKYLQCTEWPSSIDWFTKQARCEMGNTLEDGYFYVYNENRGTDDAECGIDANCWCCRVVIPEFC